MYTTIFPFSVKPRTWCSPSKSGSFPFWPHRSRSKVRIPENSDPWSRSQQRNPAGGEILQEALEPRIRCPAPTQASQFLVTVPVVQMVRWVLDRFSVLRLTATLFSASGDSSGWFDLSPVGDFPGCGIPFSSAVPFRERRSRSDSPSLTLLFSPVLPNNVTNFLPLLEFRFLCQRLVVVLCESFLL